ARATGAPVRVVSGDEEARLMLRGALHGLPPAAGVTLVFDVGGGSTEYVLTEAGAVRAAVSLRLGVVPLAERYPFPGPVEATRYRELSAEIAGRLARELPPAIRAAEPARVVGTAGTVTTLAALDLGLTRYDSARVHGHRLALDAVERLRARLAALDVAGRAALPCLEPGRADVIVAGTAIVLATLACVGARSLLASDFGVREGLLLEP
ncbi:MAG TPA: Ppx/GppA family phosphatase, partial [Methylomirabilota bacterium]|nr:Ppx/GppA family phosphatase [Methylomirabilota bacterium]